MGLSKGRMGEGGSRGTGLDRGCGCDRPQDELAAQGVAGSQTSCEGSADRIYWCGMRSIKNEDSSVWPEQS